VHFSKKKCGQARSVDASLSQLGKLLDFLGFAALVVPLEKLMKAWQVLRIYFERCGLIANVEALASVV
jgi:hypothetical protein